MFSDDYEYFNFNPVQFDDDRRIRSLIAFHVTAKVDVTHYMGESVNYFKTHIVYALDKHEAEQKCIKYYEDRNSDYDVTYFVHSVTVADTIF